MTGSIGRFDEPINKPPSCRRTTGRVQQENLFCNLGTVTDFSRGGLRMLTDRKLKGVQDVTLSTTDGNLTVQARVVWSRRTGIRRHVVGLEFLNVDPETATRLAQIATAHARAFPLAS